MATIPALEEDFLGYVRKSGYVDVLLATNDNSDQCRPIFTLSTGFGSGHVVQLFDGARNDRKEVVALRGLLTLLTRFGFHGLDENALMIESYRYKRLSKSDVYASQKSSKNSTYLLRQPSDNVELVRENVEA